MDGILIDSEPFWREGEIEEFRAVGIELDEVACTETQGIRIQEVVAYRHAEKPWTGRSIDEVSDAIVARVIDLVRRSGRPKPGVASAIALCRSEGFRLGLCSSSPLVLIQAILEKLGLSSAFEVVHSAERERHGKPHPAVYLSTAEKLGVEPASCLAIEDSLSGVISAKAARMGCIAVPDPLIRDQAKFAIADAVIASLEALTPEILRSVAAKGGRA